MKKRVLKNSFQEKIHQPLMFLLLLAILFSSCSNGDKNKKLIPVRNLTELLTEMYIANGLLAYPVVRAKFSAKDSISNYIDIIQRHGYTKERMDYTMRYYFEKKPEKLEGIYDQVLINLSEKDALLEKIKTLVEQGPVNLWTEPASLALPEKGIKDPLWFSIPVKDTGNYMLAFTALVYKDDESINPRAKVFFWHADTSQNGVRVYWPEVSYPKDGERHNYILEQRNTDTTITHISGWLYESDPREGRWVKHGKIENVNLKKAEIK